MQKDHLSKLSGTALLAALLSLSLACATVAPAPPPSASGPPPSAAPVLDPATAPLDAEISLDPAVRKGRLKNGLTYYIRVNRQPEQRAELRLFVDAGSILEDDDQRGLAHFVEHMAFNGTRRFRKHELINYLQSIGMRFGPDLNAYTSFDETVYALRVPTDEPERIARGLLVLEQWAHEIAFEAEEIDDERGVVIEEWRLSLGAGGRVRDKLFPILFADSRYVERLVIGDREVLETASHEALRRFYRDWYRPDLMAVVAVGDFDPDRVEAEIRRLFGPIPTPKSPRPRETYEVPPHEETLFGLITDPELPNTAVSVYYKQPRKDESTYGSYRESLVERLYLAMLNARLAEVAQRPDPPFLYAGAGSGSPVRPLQVYTQNAGVADGGVERGLEALLVELERADRHGFQASELERAKKDLLRSYEQLDRERDKLDSSAFAAEYGRNFLEGEPIPGVAVEAALVERFVPAVTLEEVNALARTSISEDNRVIVATAPEKTDTGKAGTGETSTGETSTGEMSTEETGAEKAASPLPTEAELLAVFESVEGRELEPWVDQVRDAPLLAARPEPGPVVEERRLEELGVTDWRLANGVRVLLKPTDFQNEEVLISGWSPGGSSLVGDELLPSAMLATALVGESGLGEFTKTELAKALAGKVARLEPYLGETEEGINGAAAPDDLETLFQLLYLTFTEPRLDTDAASSFLGRMEAYLANRLAQPEVAFQDALSEHLWRGHPRRRPLTPEVLAEVDPRAALEIYRQRFGDASDFTFVVVGSFEPAALRPLVETYLGGLPAAGREESWREIGLSPAEGVVRFEVRKGLEARSQVSLVFAGPAEWSREQLHVLASLEEVVELRLFESLREELGATYGVQVSSGLSDRPASLYNLSIGFTCAPENVDELVARVFEELRAIRERGAVEANLSKVRESQRRQREVRLRENGFWLTVLETYTLHGLDLGLILDYETLVAGVSSEVVRDAARRYLDPERYVLGVLHPETLPDEG